MLKLTDRFQKRLAFDIADCTADFYNRNGIFLRGLLPVKFRFDFVCNMRNDLYGTAAVISMTFLVQNNIEQIPEFFFTEWMRGVRRLMSCTAWSVFSLAALVCALALFLAYLLAQRLPLRKAGFYGTLVAAAVFMLTSWFAMGERREMLDDTQAVVMSLSTAVKSSPDKSATDLFVLHEGTLVEITDRLDNWCEITIADGKKGWLECKTVETI